MSAFDKLRKNSASSLEKLTEQLSKMNSKPNYGKDNDKYWKPTRDDAGNGFAIIRFLPEPDGEDIPFVKFYDHGFQGPTGQYYIEKSLNSIGQEDPVGLMMREIYARKNEEEIKANAKCRRRTHYVSNVYIIKDSAKPENEGKVFLYEYGKKIFDKLNDMMNPQFEDEKPVNIFDLWAGADFRLKIRTVDKFPNYDKSEFDSPRQLFEKDEEMEIIYNQCHSLAAILDPKEFKTFEELQDKLNKVLGKDGAENKGKSRVEDEQDSELDMSSMKEKPSREMKEETPKSSPSSDDDDDDEDLAFFQKLANKSK